MLKPALTFLAVVGLVAALLVPNLVRGDNIAPAEAKQLVEDGARLLDVRTPAEFAAGHIPGALNIPVQELDRRMGELGAKERPVVIYCRSGNRSAKAKAALEGAGFKAVHDLGAMTRW